MHSLLRTMLILLFRGLFFSGMEYHVFLPMITTFCLPFTDGVDVIFRKCANSLLSLTGCQGRFPFFPIPRSGHTATIPFNMRGIVDEDPCSSFPPTGHRSIGSDDFFFFPTAKRLIITSLPPCGGTLYYSQHDKQQPSLYC